MRILLALALLPAGVLMYYIYMKDPIDKEPVGLLLKLVLFGALCCYPAALLETVGIGLLDAAMPADTMRYAFIEAFLIVAIAEEGCKYLVLRFFTWRSADFNCTFDGIVYSVFVSLGFAALENVKYVFSYGPSVIVDRGLLSIPGHMTFAVFMGLFYSRAKKYSVYGVPGRASTSNALSLIVPILLHGFYDFCLMSGSEGLYYFFFLFVVVLDIFAIRTVNREAREDKPLTEEWRYI